MLPQIGMPELLILLVVILMMVVLISMPAALVVFLAGRFQREYGARYKRCPYCASRIRSEAIVCPHCQRALSEAEREE